MMVQLKILVCIADCPSSRVAFQFACAKAKSLGAHLEAISVIDSPDLQNPFVSDTARKEELERANEMLADYEKLALSIACDVKLTFIVKAGVFEDTVIKTINSDSSIAMLVIGYSVDTDVRHHHSTVLLTRLGKSLLVPIMVVPGNLTDNQICELNGLYINTNGD